MRKKQWTGKGYQIISYRCPFSSLWNALPMDFAMTLSFFHFLLSYFFHYVFSISGFTYLEPSYISQDPPPRIYWPWASVLNPFFFFFFKSYYVLLWASQVVLVGKNLPAVQETWVQSLDWEDLLKKGMATHSSILAWRISWTEKLGRLHSIASQSWTWLSNRTQSLWVCFCWHTWVVITTNPPCPNLHTDICGNHGCTYSWSSTVAQGWEDRLGVMRDSQPRSYNPLSLPFKKACWDESDFALWGTLTLLLFK